MTCSLFLFNFESDQNLHTTLVLYKFVSTTRVKYCVIYIIISFIYNSVIDILNKQKILFSSVWINKSSLLDLNCLTTRQNLICKIQKVRKTYSLISFTALIGVIRDLIDSMRVNNHLEKVIWIIESASLFLVSLVKNQKIHIQFHSQLNLTK